MDGRLSSAQQVRSLQEQAAEPPVGTSSVTFSALTVVMNEIDGEVKAHHIDDCNH